MASSCQDLVPVYKTNRDIHRNPFHRLSNILKAKNHKLNLLDDCLDQLPEVVVVIVGMNVMDELGYDFCVRVGLELVTLGLWKK